MTCVLIPTPKERISYLLEVALSNRKRILKKRGQFIDSETSEQILNSSIEFDLYSNDNSLMITENRRMSVIKHTTEQSPRIQR